MKKIEWNRVTWYSKLLAVVVFLVTFGIAFCLGAQWGALNQQNARGWGDAPRAGGAGAHCGGFIKDAPICAPGFHCQLQTNRPDTGGTCVAD